MAWYAKAAAQGCRFAQFNLGECYALGRGVPQSAARAAEWRAKAAAQGMTKADKMRVAALARAQPSAGAMRA